jgi:dimeric dUTPase (all-alpha-NTP-PPase superfamily)
VSEELIKSLIRKMFEKQDELNDHTNGSTWRLNKDLKWYRAIWTETAELIDYTNWKWWKQQDTNLKDIQMEVIDIWHFIMSDMMTYANINICTETFHMAFKNKFEYPPRFAFSEVQECAEFLAFKTLGDHKFHLEAFIKLCSTLNLNIEQIYKLYIGKNVLNKFRQDNGYKIKLYVKMWDGQEDNVHLMKYLDSVEEIGTDFEEEVYKNLQETYTKYITQKNSCNI